MPACSSMKTAAESRSRATATSKSSTLAWSFPRRAASSSAAVIALRILGGKRDHMRFHFMRDRDASHRRRSCYKTARMDETLTLEFDGGSRGNPGPAGIGVVVRAADGTPLVTLGRFLGRCTNNVAEYRALITAMDEAKKLGARKVIIRGDSELIVRQMLGQYRVKHPDMKALYEEAQHLIRQFDQA